MRVDINTGDPHICADCGATIFPDHMLGEGHWAQLLAHHLATGETVPTYNYVCRMELRDATLLSADYHYIEGEEQHHFRLVQELSATPRCGDTADLTMSAGQMQLACALQEGHDGKHAWFDELRDDGQAFAVWGDDRTIEWRQT